MRPLHWSTWQLYDLLECVHSDKGDKDWEVGMVYELVDKSDSSVWVQQGGKNGKIRRCSKPDKRFKFFARPKLDEEGLRRLYMRED